MDEEDRFSASSAESERENEQDEPMEDADDAAAANDAQPEEDNNNNDDDEEDEEGEGEGGGDENDDNEADGDADEPGRGVKSSKSATPAPPLSSIAWRPTVRPEALRAKLYDIVPTMAAPQSTSVNAMAITPDLRYWITGGSDGYIRKYDGPGTINGKLALTVAQKHPFVDSVTKAAILMSYWENEEPPPPGGGSGRGDQEHVLSPVYSLAVHSDALWLLSGLESGGINLQSVRHDEGKRIACLQQHTYAVSVLSLAPDERSVLSGGWDKNIFDWDLNTGQTKRSFDGNGGQISSIELRPAGGMPIPAEADEPAMTSSTMTTNNDAPMTNGTFHEHPNGHSGRGGDVAGFDANAGGGVDGDGSGGSGDGGVGAGGSSGLGRDGQASPAHESLFGGSDAGSLFGETTGEQPFGHDDDGYDAGMDMMGGQEGSMDHSADMAMAGMDMGKDEVESGKAAATQAQAQAHAQVQMQAQAQTRAQAQTPGQAQASEEAMDVDGRREAHIGANSGVPLRPASIGTQHPIAEPLSQPTQDGQDQSQPQAQPQQLMSEDRELLKRSQSPVVMSIGGVATTQQHDPSHKSVATFLSSAIDGTIRIWDRRVPNPVARIGNRVGVPPWCMSACWSPNGNMVYAGRRNGTVEEFDVYKARRGWEPERVLRFPAGSGAVSAVKPMVNGRHLVCASHDILRLYDLKETRSAKHSTVPFLIIPGPPRAGVISSLYVDPTSRFMLSAAGTRGWEGSSTEVLIGYEINVTE